MDSEIRLCLSKVPLTPLSFAGSYSLPLRNRDPALWL